MGREVQGLGTVAVLYSSLVLSTQMVFPVNLMPLSNPEGHQAQMWCTYTCDDKTLINIKMKSRKREKIGLLGWLGRQRHLLGKSCDLN